MIQIQWTCSEIKEAKKIAKDLVQKKWVACVNIIPNIVSIYEWEGEIQEKTEVKVLLKTKDAFFEKIRDYIIENCSYDVPEVSKILVSDCNLKYLDWLFKVIS